MRGKAARQATMLTAVTPDVLAPQHHPIRRIKPMVDQALAKLSPTLDRMYARPDVRGPWPGVDTAGASAESLSFDGAMLGAQRAAVLRTVGVGPAVQVVSGPERHGPQF